MTSSRHPSPILETEHLRLRPIQLDDLAFIQAMRANGEVMQEIGDLPTEPDKVAEEVRKAVDGWARSRCGFWTVLERDSHRRIGQVLLGERPAVTGEPDEATAALEEALEIGYLLERGSWGKGLATEAVGALMRYARTALEAKRIVALVRETNRASIRILERLDFTLHARVRRPGRWVLVFVWEATAGR